MKNYFDEASYNQLNINSTFYPTVSGTTVLSYQDAYPRSHYQPYDDILNPDGYVDQGTTEHLLLKKCNRLYKQRSSGWLKS